MADQPSAASLHTNSYLGGKRPPKKKEEDDMTDEKLAKLEAILYKRDIDTATRKKLAGEDKALADGSYPIENTEDLKNASTLARSGHGNVSAAKALIGRRAKALGVPNPLTKAEAVELDCELWKFDDHHIVYGTVLAPHRRDSQGDLIVKEDDIRQAAHTYLEESRESDVQHAVEKADGVTLVESAMAPHDMVIGGKPVTKGSWFAAYKITNPEVWAKVDKGELTGFSIGGSGLRLPEESALDAAVALGKAEAVEEAVEKSHLTNIHVHRVSLVDRAAVRDATHPTQPQTFLLYKRESAITPKGVPMTDIDKSALAPEVREALEKAERERDEATTALTKSEAALTTTTAELEKAKKTPPAIDDKDDKDEPPLNKADLPPAAVAALEKAERDREAMAERLTKAEEATAAAAALAKAEQDRRVQAEYIAKAQTGDLRGLPDAPAAVGPLLKQLAEAAPEAYAALEKAVLVPAAAQIREGLLFKEQGRGGEGPPPESALAKMNAQVAELRKSDSALTATAAKERAMRDNPQLAKEVAAEMRGVPLTEARAWGG
jgi:hypothetical protein